jgi:hypothetical protein
VADVPALDFFTKIINVNFGGDCMLIFGEFIGGGTSNSDRVTVDYSFPANEGGTPGFNVDNFVGAFPVSQRKVGGFDALQYTLVQKDLSLQMELLAGKGVTGFSVKAQGDALNPTETAWLINMSAFGNKPFKLRMVSKLFDTGLGVPGVVAGVQTIKSKLIKEGQKLQALSDGATGSKFLSETPGDDQTFTIDPSDLSVT